MSPDDPTILPAIREKHKRTALSVQYVLSKRTSNLFNPKERVEDHKDEVATCDIDPTGELILSGGLDCLVRICPVYTDDGYVMTMRGHSDLIMEVGFSSDGANFYTCSTDLTVANWDTGRCIRINTFEGHQDSVNTVKSTEKSPILCSGSCDGTIRIWDLRAKKCTKTLDSGYRVYATTFTGNENHVISAGDNNDIHIWDMRNNERVGNLSGHTAGVTGLDVSPCGTYLLSHSYDSTLCTWNISQTEQNAEPLNVFPSNQGPDPKYLLRCSWSKYGQLIAGGNDNGAEVNIYDVDTCRVVYTAQGHTQCVNDVKFHPYEPIVLTASNDKYMIIQEIED